jgi:hypothetical protein
VFRAQVDKFCLMRIWANSPFIGSEVAQFSRKYFFSGAVLAYAIISAYAWAGFPYDNLCEVENNPYTGAAGTYTNVQLASDKNSDNLLTITVVPNQVFAYCDQSWQGFDGLPFPPTARSQPSGLRWMGDSQESLTNVYGWTAAAFFVGFVVLFFGSAIMNYLLSWARGVYKPSGKTFSFL